MNLYDLIAPTLSGTVQQAFDNFDTTVFSGISNDDSYTAPQWGAKVISLTSSSQPGNVMADITDTAGTLTSGAYSYIVAAFSGTDVIGKSEPATITINGTSETAVLITWSGVTGATSYRVYGRNSGNPTQYWGPTPVTETSYTDIGTVGTSGDPAALSIQKKTRDVTTADIQGWNWPELWGEFFAIMESGLKTHLLQELDSYSQNLSTQLVAYIDQGLVGNPITVASAIVGNTTIASAPTDRMLYVTFKGTSISDASPMSYVVTVSGINIIQNTFSIATANAQSVQFILPKGVTASIACSVAAGYTYAIMAQTIASPV